MQTSDESDRGYDSESFLSDASTSLASSIFNYKYENGRRYHAFREGEYLLPNDEKEQDRLDLLHHIFRMMLGGRLFRAPIAPNPQRILDYGTGTGIWAMEVADEYQSAEVHGVDLSPIQPSWVPPNCKFYVDDVEDTWSYNADKKFDFIHGRGMVGAIRDWSRLASQIYANLKPGGWLEMQEYETWVKSDDGTLEQAVVLVEWQKLLEETTAAMSGKRFNLAMELKQVCVEAGFVNVEDHVFKCPIGTWAKDPKLKEIGRYAQLHILEAVEPFTIAILTRMLGQSFEEAQATIAGVKADLKSRKHHLYATYHFITAQKPVDAED
ncbi:hypothetical protein AJ80_09725 [Polytolypa hystricis UAMH7299]|uniref:Methyltransferase domain-containing protein n=1 Tax=Polytolypa hystricis (strain UAMH7299) TaxID=1447883 RepID=A0A2B7WL08_POLH7|nr:hypothetical protein AJ80_09725 [Polytolypa hystricis UAMH7299]